MRYPRGRKQRTAAEHRDPIAATPHHKHVRVRLRPVEGAA